MVRIGRRRYLFVPCRTLTRTSCRHTSSARLRSLDWAQPRRRESRIRRFGINYSPPRTKREKQDVGNDDLLPAYHVISDPPYTFLFTRNGGSGINGNRYPLEESKDDIHLVAKSNLAPLRSSDLHKKTHSDPSPSLIQRLHFQVLPSSTETHHVTETRDTKVALMPIGVKNTSNLRRLVEKKKWFSFVNAKA